MAIERSCVSPVLLLLSVVTFSHAFLSQNAVPRGNAGARNSWTRHAFANENLDDEMRYRTRYREDSDAAHELQNLQYDDDETLDIVKGDYYYEGDEDSDYEEDGLYIDEEDVEDEPTGNFWINPKQGFDSLPSERRRTSRIEEATGDHPVRRPRPRPSGKSRSKITFRSGAPSTPEPIADFYDRLFWYGFNPDESIAPGDKTLFGGTKGKFNGLNFFDDDERRKPSSARRRKRPPQAFRADEWYDDIMESLDNDGYSEEEIIVSKSGKRGSESDGDMPSTKRPSLPPEEAYYSYEDDDLPESEKEEEKEVVEAKSIEPRPRPRPPQKLRPRPPPEDWYYEEESIARRRPRSRRGKRSATRKRSRDQIASEVSSWFGPEDVYDVGDESVWFDDDERAPRRRQRREADKQPWSFTGILDGIFGVNREEVDMNAAMYNRQMGLDKRDRPQRRPSRTHQGPAYPYDEDREEAISAENDEDLELSDVVDVDAVIENEVESTEPKRKREQTIDERAAAFERVPPSVPAWGPSGEVGVDARTKATLDALEDIREATRKVELKEEECIEAKEDLVVMKADFALQKKRLLASIDDIRQVRARLRQMKMAVEDAARDLRRAKAELEVARERLAELEDQNWALLSLYDADKAFQEVVETFREFEESERLESRLVVEDSELGDTESTSSVDSFSDGSDGINGGDSQGPQLSAKLDADAK
jgi:hypothetical protein